MADWYAYAEIEPFGGLHQEFIGGQICATLANYAGMQRADDAGFANAADFMPHLIAPPRADMRPPVIELADKDAHSKLLALTIFGQE